MTKETLLADLRATRSSTTNDVGALKRELDFEAKLKKAVNNQPLLWFGSAAAVGWILAGPHTRKKVVTKVVDSEGRKVKPAAKKSSGGLGRFGLIVSLLKFAFPYIKPTLSSIATQQLTQWAHRAERR